MLNASIDRRSALRRLSAVLGGIATAPLASAVLSGCQTPGGPALAAYDFQTLGAPQQDLVAALVDQILPATDTPGAAEAGVPQFIDLMLSDWYTPEERDAFLADLNGIDGQIEGGSFVALDDAERADFVAAMDAAMFGAPAADPAPDEADQPGGELNTGEGSVRVGPVEAPPFYRQLKELTVVGYYTSEPGATEELQWNPAPGRYDPDIPLSEVGRAWA